MTKAKDRATRRILGDTEAFDTMINYIYNPLGGERFNLNHLGCPQKLFELLTVAQKYQILNLTTMTSDALESLTVIRENVIFTATVAKNFKTAFDDVSTKLLVKCLKFFFDTTSGAGDIYVDQGRPKQTMAHQSRPWHTKADPGRPKQTKAAGTKPAAAKPAGGARGCKGVQEGARGAR